MAWEGLGRHVSEPRGGSEYLLAFMDRSRQFTSCYVMLYHVNLNGYPEGRIDGYKLYLSSTGRAIPASKNERLMRRNYQKRKQIIKIINKK